MADSEIYVCKKVDARRRLLAVCSALLYARDGCQNNRFFSRYRGYTSSNLCVTVRNSAVCCIIQHTYCYA